MKSFRCVGVSYRSGPFDLIVKADDEESLHWILQGPCFFGMSIANIEVTEVK